VKRNDAQHFGGPWSIIKVEIVAKYLQAFNTALQAKPSPSRRFRRIYIDAFAGSGAFTFDNSVEATLFDEAQAAKEHAGSAKRALQVNPPFDELYFIERDLRNTAALQNLADPSVRNRVKILQGDANSEVQKLCTTIEWSNHRGVIFLDPFGTTVEWKTLESIATTRALDLWYLFPLSGVFRNSPNDIGALTADKRAAITRVLGTESWLDAFYEMPPNHQGGLFGDLPNRAVRSLNVDGIEAFVTQRLKTVFPHVEKPVRLRMSNGAPLYSLFFAVSNPATLAIKAASRIARSLLGKL